MRTQSDCFIFSAELSNLSDVENTERTLKLVQALDTNGIGWCKVEGCYKGTNEISVMVVGNYLDLVTKLSTAFSQESFLHIHNDNHAELVFGNGTRQGIGTFKQVAKEDAERSDAYSYVPSLGAYYLAR